MENLLIYGSIFNMLDELSNEEAGLLFKALNSFRKGEVVEFEDRYLKGLWAGIKPNLDKLKENYDAKVKLNQENGKKGGRPPKKSNEETKSSEAFTSDLSNVEPKVEQDTVEDKIIQPEASIEAREDNKDNFSFIETGEINKDGFKVTKFIDKQYSSLKEEIRDRFNSKYQYGIKVKENPQTGEMIKLGISSSDFLDIIGDELRNKITFKQSIDLSTGLNRVDFEPLWEVVVRIKNSQQEENKKTHSPEKLELLKCNNK